MLIVHIISTPDTRDFETLYTRVTYPVHPTVLINPTRQTLRVAILEEKRQESPTLVLIGHGTEYGLLDADLKTYLVDESWRGMLSTMTIIGIWCYAGNFADRLELKGFFTSNFVSNSEELFELGISSVPASDYQWTCDRISWENKTFASMIGQFLARDYPLALWCKDLQKYSDASPHIFVKYNYEAFYCSESE